VTDQSAKTSKISEEENPPRKKRSSCLLVFLLGVLLMVCLFGYSMRLLSEAPKKFLENQLPAGSEMVAVEEEWGGGLNGDYQVAAKIKMSPEDFVAFVKSLKVPKVEDENPGELDVSASCEPWWVEPREETIIYKQLGKRYIRKVFYQDGAAYYIDKGW